MANNWVNQTAGSSVALIAVKFSGRRWLPLALCFYRAAHVGQTMTPEYRIETEKMITSYLKGNDVTNIKYMQVEQTYRDLGSEINVWNVKTKSGNWWVVEGEGAPMNLYTQNEFYFSSDEAYSFHMGITQRLQARHHKEFKHIIDELPLDIDGIKSISRRLNLAAVDLNNVVGVEDIQSIGLTCRESLIELAAALVDANPTILEENGLKAADFKGIAKVVISNYAKGNSNSNLRKHTRKGGQVLQTSTRGKRGRIYYFSFQVDLKKTVMMTIGTLRAII